MGILCDGGGGGARRWNSKNIDEAMKSEKPEIIRFVGTEGAYGEELGLSKDWAARISVTSATTARFTTAMLASAHSRYPARPQPALERGRHPVRAADPLICCCAMMRSVQPSPRSHGSRVAARGGSPSSASTTCQARHRLHDITSAPGGEHLDFAL